MVSCTASSEELEVERSMILCVTQTACASLADQLVVCRGVDEEDLCSIPCTVPTVQMYKSQHRCTNARLWDLFWGPIYQISKLEVLFLFFNNWVSVQAHFSCFRSILQFWKIRYYTLILSDIRGVSRIPSCC